MSSAWLRGLNFEPRAQVVTALRIGSVGAPMRELEEEVRPKADGGERWHGSRTAGLTDPALLAQCRIEVFEREQA